MQDARVKLNPGLPEKVESLHQQRGLKFKEETRGMLHLQHSFVRCWHVDTSESRLEISGEFWKMVLVREEEAQFDRSCEKWRSVTES